MMKNLPIEDQYNRTSLFKKENVNELIRILTRFGTIPKINSINIITSNDEPDLFKIIPGKSIKIGANFLNNPIVALIYLRYGIEWQIWYRGLGKNKSHPILCDIAALQVTHIFFNLLPKEDKIKLKESNHFLAEFIQNIETINIDSLTNDIELVTKLQFFHGLNNFDKKIKKSWKPIIEELAKPTEYLLMSGGDLRLNIDEDKLLNKYGCRPFPRPEAYTFASSTATSVSNFAFDKTEIVRAILIKRNIAKGLNEATSGFSELLKNNLRKALKINKECQIIFSPSGTDSSLQIAALTQVISKKDIIHILVASEETGSGVPAALKGLHFENTTALNYPVKKGDRIDGFRDVELVKVPLRDENGSLKSTSKLDEEVLNAITKAKDLGKYIVLHIMDQSKLGYQSPSEELMHKLDKRNNLSMQIIVDGAQLRLDPKDINSYLNKGYIVTITGSKYFTGPPYSGALIVPKSVSDSIKSVKNVLPKGLTNYYNRSDWPTCWFCSKQLSDGFNYGTYMRWNAAIAEMDRYFKTPILYRNLGIEMFCNFVEDSIKEAPFLEPLFDEETKISTYNSEEFGLRNIRTIFPFFIHKDNRVLEIDEIKKLYLLLNYDISNYFHKSPIETIRIASQKCHIGQAVTVKHKSDKETAVLRISLGARVISESWKDRDISMFFRNIEEQMDQITIIIKKIELIINNPILLK